MKLRNKKTGEIVEATDFNIIADYNSLAELDEEWEDYEEPENDYYFLRDGGNIDWHWYKNFGEITDRRKEIGNYFETKEEAEKAVEKLKAWKRMKDTGCKPINWRWKQDYPNDACYVEVVLKCQFDSGVHDKELDLLFGGES